VPDTSTAGHAMTNPMAAVFDKYDTDKNSSWHDYPRFYHRYLEPYTRRPGLRYLEIGVWRGESLRAFREYFHLADRLVGIDIDGDTKRYENGVDTYVEIGDQADAAFLTGVHEKHGPFDVILDDGSHREPDVVASFETLFPLLRDGGVYVVEDSVCIRDDLRYFHSLTRHLNKKNDDWCVDPAKIHIDVDDPIERSVGDIVFTNSAILIHKCDKPHWALSRYQIREGATDSTDSTAISV
jgi:hypothetical protein